MMRLWFLINWLVSRKKQNVEHKWPIRPHGVTNGKDTRKPYCVQNIFEGMSYLVQATLRKKSIMEVRLNFPPAYEYRKFAENIFY
jgi:hypothetical protein